MIETPLKSTLKFKIIEGTDPDQFEEDVNLLLKQGWVFNGETQIFAQSKRPDGTIIELFYLQPLKR